MDRLPDRSDELPSDSTIETLRRRLGSLDSHQITAWRAMPPARRLDLAFQAYQFALDALRLTERRRHPELPPDELAWRVTQRMQGDRRLGKLALHRAFREQV